MKVTPSSIISFLLLLLWSSLSLSAPLSIPASNAIDTTTIAKRGCVQSKEGTICTEVPTVAELVTKIKAALGDASAQQTAKTWHKANAEKANGRAGVVFDGIVSTNWYIAQATELQKQPSGSAKVEQFQRRLSQAFAQASNNKVYFFTAAGQDGTKFATTTTWGGWEYPALTRNAAVTEVIQVSMTGTKGTTKTIWKRGDRATTNPPLG